MKIWSSLLENICSGVSFVIKLLTPSLQLYEIKGSDICVFLWILQNVHEHPFKRAFANGCFEKLGIFYFFKS